MSLKLNKTLLLFSALFLILLIIPSSFASDINETSDLTISDNGVEDILTDQSSIIYVSTEGNDTNDGSQANPLATIKRAVTLANMNNQSHIYILSGVYNEHDIKISSNLDITGVGNVTIDAQAKGRIFTVNDGLTVNFENLNLINGQGKTDIYVPYSGYMNGAGAIYVGEARVYINNLTFIGNEADGCGGAIVWDGRNGVIRNSKFINNYGGTYGGAIDWEGSDGRIQNCTFISNQADNGGAIFYDNSVLNLIDSTFEKNVASWGGAVSIITTQGYDDNYVTGNKFIQNEADSYGGAIVLDNEQLVSCSSYTIISENRFENNAAAYGGAISAYYANTDIISNIFINHTASYGGVIASSGVIYLKNNTMVNSTATTIGNEIYNVGTFSGFLNITFIDGKCVEVTGNSIKLNATVTDDMGNSISGGSVKFTVNDTETLYSPSILTNGFCYVAFAPRENGTYVISGNYGDVAPRYSNVTVGYINVTNASADYFGPIYLSQSLGDDGNVGSENSPVATFEVAFSLASREGGSNTIIVMPGRYDVARYEINYKSFTIIGQGNPILDAGDNFMFSFYGYKNSFLNISGVTLANGYASSSTYGGNHAGGAIFFKGGHLYLENVNFVNNSAEDFGGAVHINKGFNLNTGKEFPADATIINCTFENNQVSIYEGDERNVGGAVSTYGATVTIINSTFINNFARFGGALGIQLYHGGMTVINCSFVENGALRYGGAVFLETVSPFTVGIYNSTFDSNYALFGGAVDVATAVIDNCTFKNNEADYDGGALLTYGDEVITNNKFINNTASRVGGAILIHQNPSQIFFTILQIHLENNTITDCKAPEANEIYIDSELDVSGLIITVLENMTKVFSLSESVIYANVTDDMGNLVTTSNFTFIINNNTYETNVSEGVASILYNITIQDNNEVVDAIMSCADGSVVVKTGIIKIATGEIIIVFDNASGVLRQDIIVPVYVLDKNGNPIDQGILNVTFNSNTFNVNITGGVANVMITLPGEVGQYPLTVQYGNVSLTRYVIVNQTTPTITIDVSPVFVGENNTIYVSLEGDAEGNITIIVDNDTYIKTLKNGFASLEVSNLVNKTYKVTVYYPGNDKYTNATAYTTFEVFKVSDFEISAKTNQIHEGQNLTVTVEVPSDATGNVSICINNKTYTSKINNSKAIFNIEDLKAGFYDLTATYEGNEKYTEKTSEISVIVSKVSDYEIDVNSTVVRQGENTTVTVTLPSDANGKVLIRINNKTYEVFAENGTAILNITDLTEGTYDMEVTYGDSKYLIKSVNARVVVKSPVNVKLIVDNLEKYYGSSNPLVIKLFDIEGNPLNNLPVNITINSRTYTRTVSNGTATLGINLISGKYDVNVLFNGTGDYDKVSANATVLIKKTINASDIVKIYRNATQFVAYFIDSEGNPLVNKDVTFNINGRMYTRTTNEKGAAQLDINLPQGKYIITSMNSVTGEKAANNVTVIGKIVENHDLTKYFKNSSQYTVKVLDNVGNSVGAGKTVTFNINGIFYRSTTDENGIAQLNINLPPGEYIITAEYDGYKASNNIKVLPVLSAEDLVMHYMDGQQFEAKLLDGQGKPLKGENVRFNINGVFYDKTTDADGIARLDIRLLAGEYIITSSFNGVNVANKVTVIG